MIAGLVERLNRGWNLCEVASSPEELERLEAHWTRLLHEYERACDDRIGDVESSAAEAA